MKNVLALLTVILFLSSCDNGFLEKEDGNFTVDGTVITFNADQMSANYLNDSTLNVVLGGAADSPHSINLRIDLTTIGGVMPIFSLNREGFGYFGTSAGGGYFQAVNGLYEITEHVVGNSATQHTEGTFRFEAVNQYATADTIVITEGHFYVSNY